MKNGVFWDVTRCGSCKNRRFGEHSTVFLRSVRRVLVTASVVPRSPILVTLVKEELSSLERSVLTRATRRNIPTDAISHRHLLAECIERMGASMSQDLWAFMAGYSYSFTYYLRFTLQFDNHDV
jgi:hypothetical protein